MSNPIFDQLPMHQSQPQQSSGLMGMINQVRNSPNPQQTLSQMAQNNPKLQNVMNYIQANGGNAKTAFYNMAAEKGVDPNSILAMLRQGDHHG